MPTLVRLLLLLLLPQELEKLSGGAVTSRALQRGPDIFSVPSFHLVHFTSKLIEKQKLKKKVIQNSVSSSKTLFSFP